MPPHTSPAPPALPPQNSSQNDELVRIANVKGLASLLRTSYHPAALRHLPQPTPNDVPKGLDRSIFTYEDAFEDLLSISQGQDLPDIRRRYDQRQLLREMFPFGEPTWFWFRRLRASGLLSLDKQPQQQKQQQQREDYIQPNWKAFHSELHEKTPDVWKRQKHPDKDDFNAKDVFGAIGESAGQLSQQFDKINKLIVSRQFGQPSFSGSDSLDEWIVTIRDFADSGRRSWDAFMKSFSESPDAAEKPNHPSIQQENKLEESRDEYVDKFGYVHSKVTRRELDAEGREVGRSTSYRIFPAGQNTSNEHRDDSPDDGLLAIDPDAEKRKSGWFWK